MANTYFVQQNIIREVDIIALPIITSDYLTYQGGGGTIFGTTLQNDLAQSGGQYHQGNPSLTGNSIPIYRVGNKVNIIKETIDVVSPLITRGLFIYRQLVSSPSDINSKTNGKYYWDEVYTSPIGVMQVASSGSSSTTFSLSGNQLVLQTNDINIIPKEGDYIVFQLINTLQHTNLPSDVSAPTPGEYSDGFSNLPVIFNTETYQLKILSVSFSAPAGVNTIYTIVTDKSLSVATNDYYSIVLLNRENTGLQKELFYDTFNQVEVHRDQLLGDPYFNTFSTFPLGRKNYLNYNQAQYLGLRNLLLNNINAVNQEFIETPFMVYDITNDIQDRFNPQVSTLSNINFQFHLPLVMIQEDTSNDLNILTNYGIIQNETTGVGRYSGLYLQWSPTTGKRYGFVFYDLRIVVIDDSELALALAYNSNRNYTLPQSSFTSTGNSTANNISTINLSIIGLQNNSSGGATVVVVNGKHGLSNGDAVTITDVNVIVPGSNQIQSASVNDIKYIKRYYTDPINLLGELTDRFYVYNDQSLTTGVIGNGQFINNGVGNSGSVHGASLTYNYFYTYRIKNDRYSSILPYSQIQSFNFATDASVDNANGSLNINIPQFTYLNHPDGGFECNDLEIIIGKWSASDPTQPFLITGIEDVVVISVQDTPTPNLPNNISSINLSVPISLYNSFVARIGNGLGAYDFTTNPNGDPNYDVLNNLKHYNITSGTFDPTLYTAEGKWTLGNLTYQTQVEQYRAKMQVVVGAGEWNDTTNPSYDPTNPLIQEKYISEIALCGSGSDTPIVYAKISPAIKKTPDLDLLVQLSIDM